MQKNTFLNFHQFLAVDQFLSPEKDPKGHAFFLENVSARKTTFSQAEISYESQGGTICPNESLGKQTGNGPSRRHI